MKFSLDPLKPYVTTIKWIAGAIIASVIFVGGCNYGGKNMRETNTALALQVQELRKENDKHIADIQEANRQVLANQQFAKERQEALEKAETELKKLQAEEEKTLDNNRAALDKAKRNPKCAELLQLKVCSAIPLP